MCLALKAKILEVNGIKATADFGNFRKEVESHFIKLKKGDKVLCFSGQVIEKL